MATSATLWSNARLATSAAVVERRRAPAPIAREEAKVLARLGRAR